MRYFLDIFMKLLHHFDPNMEFKKKIELSDLDDLTVIQAILISSKAIANTKSYQYRVIDP